MKNKSCSLMEKISKINYSKNAKFLILIPVVIIALAVMITSIFGLNYARELQTRYEFNVDFGVEISNDDINEYITQINDALTTHDMSSAQYTKSGRYIYTGLNITLDKVNTEFSEEEIDDIQKSIEETLQASINDTVEVGKLQLIKSDINGFVIKTLIAGIVVLVAVFVYLWIRFGLIMALSNIINAIITAGLIFALYGLFRMPFGYSSLAIMFVGSVLAIVTHIAISDNIRNLEIENQSMTNNDYIVDSIKTGVNFYILLASFIAVVSIITLFINVYVFVTLILFAISILISQYGARYIATSFWSIVYNKEKDQRLINRIERQTKSSEKKAKKSKNEKDDEKVIV